MGSTVPAKRSLPAEIIENILSQSHIVQEPDTPPINGVGAYDIFRRCTAQSTNPIPRHRRGKRWSLFDAEDESRVPLDISLFQVSSVWRKEAFRVAYSRNQFTLAQSPAAIVRTLQKLTPEDLRLFRTLNIVSGLILAQKGKGHTVLDWFELYRFLSTRLHPRCTVQYYPLDFIGPFTYLREDIQHHSQALQNMTTLLQTFRECYGHHSLNISMVKWARRGRGDDKRLVLADRPRGDKIRRALWRPACCPGFVRTAIVELSMYIANAPCDSLSLFHLRWSMDDVVVALRHEKEDNNASPVYPGQMVCRSKSR